MKKKSQLGFSIIFVLLAAILMISVYTVVLQRSYGCIAEEAAVARDTKCADVIHQVVSDKFNRNDFQTITTKADMETARYQELQQELNELRRLNSTRYLYTAKRGDDGRLIYLIDGLDLDAEDFAYPGTYIEEEMIPYIDAAMNGQTIYSSEIVDTTWGHIFTACYPVVSSDGSGDIIGALCMEMDMEDTYAYLEKSSQSSFKTACVAVAVSILLAGWSSNNKYSLIGAMRSGAQMISYELSIGLSILTIVVLTDTMQFSEIVARQADGWFIFKGHVPALVAFVIYLIAGNAEVNRGPFDLPEAESELTAGYHTEYSGMHFGLFYVAEFVNLFVVSGVAATIFLGGWMPLHIPGWEGFNAAMDYIPGFVWFFGKAFFVVWLLMWIKWTFPRLRIDQILTLEWKYLVPIGLANLLLMVIVVVFKLHF